MRKIEFGFSEVDVTLSGLEMAAAVFGGILLVGGYLLVIGLLGV